jgi:hypothetical protein
MQIPKSESKKFSILCTFNLLQKLCLWDTRPPLFGHLPAPKVVSMRHQAPLFGHLPACPKSCICEKPDRLYLDTYLPQQLCLWDTRPPLFGHLPAPKVVSGRHQSPSIRTLTCPKVVSVRRQDPSMWTLTCSNSCVSETAEPSMWTLTPLTCSKSCVYETPGPLYVDTNLLQ